MPGIPKETITLAPLYKTNSITVTQDNGEKTTKEVKTFDILIKSAAELREADKGLFSKLNSYYKEISQHPEVIAAHENFERNISKSGGVVYYPELQNEIKTKGHLIPAFSATTNAVSDASAAEVKSRDLGARQ